MFEVKLSSEAAAFYADADRPLAKKLSRCFAVLELDPHHHSNIKRLTGDRTGLLRYRIGDWRVLYRIDADKNQVNVLVIAHRREAYD